MKLKKITIKNFKSIVEINDISIDNFQALVGENNAGKSNILSSIDVFSSGGSSGVSETDFNDPTKPIEISCVFSNLSKSESNAWKKYLVKNELRLVKFFTLTEDEKTKKKKIEVEFHGFESEPSLEHLSIKKIEKKGVKDFTSLVTENKLPDYFLKDGKSNKTLYTKGLEKYLQESEVEFDEHEMSQTHALGLKSNVTSKLPKIFILPAITNYKDETDSRKSNTIFNRLMSEITERILKSDPKYVQLQNAVNVMTELFNGGENKEATRFEKLSEIEKIMTENVKQLMPTVSSMKLLATIEGVENLLRQSIEIKVDDGLATDVLSKGHGLQRCIIFSLLQSLIQSERGQLLESEQKDEKNSIILLIEEPELYIHSQIRGLFFDALEEFSKTDQVIFTTHSSDFIDISNFDKIALVQKKNLAEGSKVLSPDFNVKLSDKEKFKKLTKVNPYLNEILFSKKVLLVEGPEDRTAVIQGLITQNKIRKRIEELGLSIVVAGGKSSIPDIIRVLNAFNLEYIVLHDTDLVEGLDDKMKNLRESENKKISDLISSKGKLLLFEPKLEAIVSCSKHFKDQYEALEFFLEPENHSIEFQEIIKKIS